MHLKIGRKKNGGNHPTYKLQTQKYIPHYSYIMSMNKLKSNRNRRKHGEEEGLFGKQDTRIVFRSDLLWKASRNGET